MQEFLEAIAPALIGLFGAAAAYLKIKSERNETKQQRDERETNLEHRLSVLETKVSDLGDLKIEVREMASKLAELCGIVKTYMDKK